MSYQQQLPEGAEEGVVGVVGCRGLGVEAACRDLPVRAGPRQRLVVGPEVEVEDGVVEARGTGTGGPVSLRGDADEGVALAGPGLGCSHDRVPPGCGVRARDYSDAVCLVQPSF